MGATLSVSSSKDQPSDDEKWLKTSAHDLFDLEVFIYIHNP